MIPRMFFPIWYPIILLLSESTAAAVAEASHAEPVCGGKRVNITISFPSGENITLNSFPLGFENANCSSGCSFRLACESVTQLSSAAVQHEVRRFNTSSNASSPSSTCASGGNNTRCTKKEDGIGYDCVCKQRCKRNPDHGRHPEKCWLGLHGNGKGGCIHHAAALVIGPSSSIALLLLGLYWLYRVQKQRRLVKLRKEFFKQHGGLLLEQHISSNQSSIQKIKIFTARELEKATNNYNENQILGQGGQGTVYRGMLPDGTIIAVKKSGMVANGQTEQFINEVAILTQINHRHIVKLLGCCLETEVPLLVYEFVSNGTLSNHLHDQIEELPLKWADRLRIATEVAVALSYMHSTASPIPIYHRDIKSMNILLDAKYEAKVSDFGISRSLPIEKTHLTTSVQGTIGYLDPEYFRSSQFTEKSDVYSFGIVLVELLTGRKPTSSTLESGTVLVLEFVSAMKKKCLFDILDAQVVKEGAIEEIIAVATLAKWCLKLKGKKRPTMKQVALELENMTQLREYEPTGHNDQVIDCFVTIPSESEESEASTTMTEDWRSD